MNKKELVENVKYIVLGIVTAYLFNLVLGLALDTDLPVVAVVSESMTHDVTTELHHYQFLEENYGYTREQIDSWPLKNGFRKGDVLIIKGVNRDELEVGDVIVYNIDSEGRGIPIVHRIIKIDKNEIVTKGDHNIVEDQWNIGKIRGKAVFVIPYIGWPKLVLTYILSAVFR